MRGASRASFAGSPSSWKPRTCTRPTAATRLGDELFAVVDLLDREPGLRRALSDPGKPGGRGAAVASALLHGQVTGRHRGRWSRLAASPLVDAGRHGGRDRAARVAALRLAAEAEASLDDLEDGLFRFGRIVGAEPELRAALADHAAARRAQARAAGARCCAGKVTPAPLRLITQAVTYPRGRSLEATLDEYARLAAGWRERLIAVVRVAAGLTDEQRGRLAAALAATYGHEVHLNIVDRSRGHGWYFRPDRG